jgi:sulfatase modifying factor 1
MRRLSYLFFAFLFFLPAISPAKEIPKLAVWDLAPGDIKAAYAQDLTSILVSEISKLGKYEVYSQENVRTLAGWAAERMQLGCTDTKCLTALGQMDISKLISGRVGKIGNRYSVSLNLFDTQNARAEKSISEFGRSEDELIDLVQVAIRKLLGVEIAPTKVEVAPTKVEQRPSPSVGSEISRDDRFNAYRDGTVLDTRTNLMWAAKDNGSNINWPDAKRYCENYRGGGYKDWRMPTMDELAGLYDKLVSGNKPYFLTPHITLTGSSPWASESRGSDAANFHFNFGERSWHPRSDTFGHRALPVRMSVQKTPEKEWMPMPVTEAGKSFKDSVSGIEFVFVKGGCFQMGNTFGGGFKDENPVHEVCLDDYYLGKYEVTQGQWQAVMGSNPSYFKSCGSDCPVERVSWNEAQEFISRLNQKSGRRFRLPTEAEWEYAARSGGKREKWSGTISEVELELHAWYHENSGKRTHPVGEKRPNGLGLYDMSGNVTEWCSDWYEENYYQVSPRNNPKGPFSGELKVVRGGPYNAPATSVRASQRAGAAHRGENIGFRLGLSAQ